MDRLGFVLALSSGKCNESFFSTIHRQNRVEVWYDAKGIKLFMA